MFQILIQLKLIYRSCLHPAKGKGTYPLKITNLKNIEYIDVKKCEQP